MYLIPSGSFSCFNFTRFLLDGLYHAIDTSDRSYVEPHQILYVRELADPYYEELFEENYPPDEVEKDRAIRWGLRYLRRSYKDKEPPDYSGSATRFAYTYCYVPAHAEMVYQLISESSALKTVFDSKSVRIASIGGGPGSDILGIIKFLRLEEKLTRLICDVYDRQEIWRSSCQAIVKRLDTPFRKEINFHLLDVTEKASWRSHAELCSADLFTMIYFLSEICSMKEKVRPFFENLFGRARSGAAFLLIDRVLLDRDFGEIFNNDDWLDTPNWLDTLAESQGVHIVECDDYFPFCISGVDKRPQSLGRYYDKFEGTGHPKLRATIVYRIYRKG